VALVALGLVLLVPTSGFSQAPRPGAKLEPDLLARVEKELLRLAKQAKGEGPLVFAPSQEVAYYLLTGLATQGDEINKLGDADRKAMRLGRAFAGKVIALTEGKRIVLGEEWMCLGRSGMVYRFAEYYSLRDGKWVKLGEGMIFPRK
jgi:hypothetical protein